MLSEVQAEVSSRPAETAFVLLLDFDGTLAEFNPDPAAPELTLERFELLSAISRAQGMSLGIVSGRRLDDLRARTRCPTMSTMPACTASRSRWMASADSTPICAAAEERVDGLADCLAEAAAGIPGVIDRGQEAPASRFTSARLPEDQYERIFARADVLAVPWIAEGHVRRLEGNCRRRVSAEHQWPQGRCDALDR